MKCMHCEGTKVKKNGVAPNGSQRFFCHDCKRVFLDRYKVTLSDRNKELAIKARNEGMSYRGIARVLGVCSWFAIYSFLKKSSEEQGKSLPNLPVW